MCFRAKKEAEEEDLDQTQQLSFHRLTAVYPAGPTGCWAYAPKGASQGASVNNIPKGWRRGEEGGWEGVVRLSSSCSRLKVKALSNPAEWQPGGYHTVDPAGDGGAGSAKKLEDQGSNHQVW